MQQDGKALSFLAKEGDCTVFAQMQLDSSGNGLHNLFESPTLGPNAILRILSFLGPFTVVPDSVFVAKALACEALHFAVALGNHYCLLSPCD